MEIEIINSTDLTSFILACETALLKTQPTEFFYPELLQNKNISDPVWENSITEIKELNDDFLSSLRGNANIYAIHIKDDEEYKVAYVGQRKSMDMRERITQHLITKDPKTNSKLEYVRCAVSRGCKIGMTFIKTDKDTLRTFVEEEIISRNKPSLLWNIQV